MGLFGKLTGEREGDPGVEPVPVSDLRAALLALGGGSWSVRDGADHGCDLVAEWGTEVERHGPLSDARLKAAFRVKMKFHEAEHEVRHNSQQSTTSSGNLRGVRPQPGGQAGYGGFGQGSQPAGLGYNFNSSDITHPLRDTVTRLGWAWKAALFKL
jgi:hypothetical protein